MKIRQRISKKWLVIVAAGVIGAVTLIGGLIAYQGRNVDTATVTQQPTPTPPQPEPNPEVVQVSAMGDMLAHDTIVANAKTATGYDFSRYFTAIRPLYQQSDVVFCNQEGLSSGPQFGISGYPAFNAPTEFSVGLQDGAGCNLINLANNHMGDKGAAATNATIDTWQKLNPLGVSGANKDTAGQNTVAYAEVKGIKIGFVSFADFNNNAATPTYSVNLYHDTALVEKLVSEARENSDVVIVSMHWGTEDSAVPNADQKQQVSLLASLGVDVIIGTGPHVLQPVEIVDRPDGKKMTVWYSLGNMLSSQLQIPQLFSGIAGFTITKQPGSNEVSVSQLTFVPTYMHYEWTASEAAAGNLLARKNASIYPLSQAAEPLSRSQLNTTVDQQRSYIVTTLGPSVEVK